MNKRIFLPMVMLLVVAAMSTGCIGNPALRKQRYLESGNRYSAEGRYREASIQYMNALKVDADFPEAHYALAQAYEHLGQFDTAREELERTVDSQPGNNRARVELGNLLFAMGRTEDAHIQADAALAAQPDDPGAHALRSAIAARIGQTEEALNEIERALELDPKNAVFHDDLALLEERNAGKAAMVEGELKKAVELAPDSLNAKLLLAAFYARNNRLLEAERLDWEAVTADPRNITARANVVAVILKEGDWARAEQALRQTSKDLASEPQGASMLANYYASTGQFVKAKAEFAALTVRFPKDASVQEGYIRVLIESHDFVTARKSLDALIKSNPKDPGYLALNGVLLLNEGNSAEALNALRSGARSFPQDAFIQYWLGKAALAMGNPNFAEASFRQAVSLDPSDSNSLEEWASLASRRGDTATLADVAEQAIAASPNFADGYVWRAIVEMDRNKPAQAEADLRNAIKLSPQCWQAYLQLGKLSFAQKHFAKGSAMLGQALIYNPDSVEALRLLVDYDLYQKNPKAALDRVNAQIGKAPAKSSFYDLLAQIELGEKDLNQAAAAARKAMELNPADGEAVMLFAQIAIQRGETANEIETWQKWSNEHPHDAGALAILGTLEESRGDGEKADVYYRKSLQIQPQQPIAANNLAYRMLLSGQSPDVALSLAETARQAMPDSPNTADTLAWAYYSRGTYQFARDLLENAVNSNPDSAPMQYHLGMVCSKMRDPKNAAIHLKKALALAPNSEIAKDARIALQGLS